MTNSDTQRFGVAARAGEELPPPASVGNAILGAMFLAVLFGSLWLMTNLLTAPSTPRDSAPFVAYYPAMQSARAGAPVMLANQPVGRVDSIQPGFVGVQIQIYPGRMPEVSVFRTLVAPYDILIVPASGLQVAFERDSAGAALDISWPGTLRRHRIVATLARGGGWAVAPPADGDDPGLVAINGAPRRLAVGDTLRAGDFLLLNGTGLQLNNLVHLTRVTVALDTAQYRSAAEPLGGNGAGHQATLGAGSALSLGNALGFGVGSAELIPSYRAPDSRVLPSRQRRELEPRVAGDPLQVLTDMTVYLNSPAALNTPPNNRFQKIVDDLNGTLAEIRIAVGFVAAQVRLEGGAGAVGRLVFEQDTQRSLDEIIANLTHTTESLSGTLEIVRASAAGLDFPGVIGNLLFGDGGDDLDLAINTVATAARKGTLLDLLLTTSDEQELTEVLQNLSAFTLHVRKLSKDLALNKRSGLEVVLGDAEAKALLHNVGTRLDDLGGTARTVGLGVVGIVLVQILSGLFF